MTIRKKLGAPVNFKKARFPSKKKIIGKYINLESININRHAKDLFDNFSLDKINTLWTYMPHGPFKDLPSFKNYLNKKCLNKNVLIKIHFSMLFTQKD